MTTITSFADLPDLISQVANGDICTIDTCSYALQTNNLEALRFLRSTFHPPVEWNIDGVSADTVNKVMSSGNEKFVPTTQFYVSLVEEGETWNRLKFLHSHGASLVPAQDLAFIRAIIKTHTYQAIINIFRWLHEKGFVFPRGSLKEVVGLGNGPLARMMYPLVESVVTFKELEEILEDDYDSQSAREAIISILRETSLGDKLSETYY